MKLTRVLIADADGDFRLLLRETLEENPDMEVVGAVGDGAEALSLVCSGGVDVLVMDMVLTTMDGLELLNRMGEQVACRPEVLLVSGFVRGNVVSQAADLGVGYFLAKPCRMEHIAERIRIIRDCSGDCVPLLPELEEQVTDMLHEIGMPAHVIGYQYLRHAIQMVVEDNDAINAVTKVLYPGVAKHFGSTPARVERAIRNAIELAWSRGDMDVLRRFFGYTIASSKGKPTNSEFIALLSDKIRLQRKRFRVINF